VASRFPLATVRLIPPGESALRVDLLFTSSGIEGEIVAAAEPIEVIENLVVRVATIPHLITTKILSRDNDPRTSWIWSRSNSAFSSSHVISAVAAGAAGSVCLTARQDMANMAI
jgi:hypothetical protein